MGNGDVPKWLKGADSKSARRRKACGGSNPSISANKKRTFVYQDKGAFFELSVPLRRNVKDASQVKRTSCVKCAFGTICGTLNFTMPQA